MNPATVAALTTALVWSSILDAILVRANADSNSKSGLELKTMVSKKIWKTVKHLAYLLILQRNSTIFGTALMRVHGQIAFSTEDCTGSKGCSDFLIFSTTGDIHWWHSKIIRGVEKHLCFTNTHTIGKIRCSDVGCSPTIEEMDFVQEHNSLVLQNLNKKNINYIVAR
jgi:hypothetical protein